MPNDPQPRRNLADGSLSQEEMAVEMFGKEDLKRLLDDHQRLLILYGFANAISAILDRELLLHEAMNVVFGLVKADRGALFLFDSRSGNLTQVVSRTKDKATPTIQRNAVINAVLSGKKAILAADALTETPAAVAEELRGQQIRSCLCVPLASQHRLLGLLYVDHLELPRYFTLEHLTLVSGIANQTAVALENIESVQRLKTEQRRVEDILATLPIAILSIDEREVITFVNPNGEKLFGIVAKECLGKPYHAFFKNECFQPLFSLIHSALERGERKILEEVICGDSSRPLVLQADILPFQEGSERKGVLVALNDVTEKKNLERKIRHTEKLSAIGEMAAGLIHEINNPLNIISGRAQLLLLEKTDDPAVLKAGRVIWEQVDRANAITEKLLSFAKQRLPKLEPLSLEGLLDKCLETMEEQFASQKIRVTKTYEAVPTMVMGDPEQLEEVFVNLAQNAIQAMAGGGAFTVKTQRKDALAEIALADTGCGIPQEYLPKIFIPFFTTKSRGTGLGLSIVHGIIENHGGELKVESQVGKGATFIFTLPLKKENDA
ncbi:MAG: ATP-binding protein [Candidatus Omnitrophota bacterium]